MPAIFFVASSFLGLIEQKRSEISALHSPRAAGRGQQPGPEFK
jgi:hypothetical protein